MVREENHDQYDILDEFFDKICNSLKDLSPEFKDFAKTVPTMFHGITESVRGFSINKHCVSENMHEESLMARRRVCEEKRIVL